MNIGFWSHSSGDIAKVNLKKKRLQKYLETINKFQNRRNFLDLDKESSRAEGSARPR